jgi:hypothetical protein
MGASDLSPAEISLGENLRGHLDSYLAVEPRVARLAHFIHAARVDGRKDLLGAKAVLRLHTHLSNPARQLVTSSSGASAPGSRMTRTRKRLPSGATS